jgi:hypothetical protein
MKQPRPVSRVGVVLLTVAITCFGVAAVISVVNHERINLVWVGMGVVAIAQLTRMLRKSRTGTKPD